MFSFSSFSLLDGWVYGFLFFSFLLHGGRDTYLPREEHGGVFVSASVSVFRGGGGGLI